METREVLYSLIRTTLGKGQGEQYKLEQMRNAFHLSKHQEVCVLAFDGFQKSKDRIIDDKKNDLNDLKKKWLGTTVVMMKNYQQLLLAQNTIADQLETEDIKALVLKGAALAQYYDNAEYRQFGDIDIYSPLDFERLDTLLKKIGVGYDLECYRHSQCKVQGKLVENHIYLTDARWKIKWQGLEDYLSHQADVFLKKKDKPGLYNPNDLFSAVFFVYHALAHFVYDRINVKFLVDWYYMLMKRSNMDDRILEEKLEEFGLMSLAAALTALCLTRLSLDEKYVPQAILRQAKNIKPSVLKKFEDDMYDTTHSGFTTNSLKDRIARLSTFYQNRWKIEYFYGMSLPGFVWNKVSAIIKWN